MSGERTTPTGPSAGPGSADREQKTLAFRLRVATGVTAVALVLLAGKTLLQALYPSMKFDDALSAGLLVVAALPWVAQLLTSAKLPGGWEFVFQEFKENQDIQQDMLMAQQKQIEALRTAVRGIVTRHEFEKLDGLSQDGPFPCRYSDDMFDELKRLRALTYITNVEGKGLAQMARDHKGKDTEFDLKGYFYILEEGRKYLRIRGDTDGGGP
jgi:hypothetical protein